MTPTSGESLMRNTSAESLVRNTSSESLHKAPSTNASRSSSGLSMVPFKNLMQMVRFQTPESSQPSTPRTVENIATVESEEPLTNIEVIKPSVAEMRKKLVIKARQRKLVINPRNYSQLGVGSPKVQSRTF